jgi:hypothetical protein
VCRVAHVAAVDVVVDVVVEHVGGLSPALEAGCMAMVRCPMENGWSGSRARTYLVVMVMVE